MITVLSDWALIALAFLVLWSMAGLTAQWWTSRPRRRPPPLVTIDDERRRQLDAAAGRREW